MCLSGRSHSEVGAETLTQWKFPLEIVEAVRWHHRPERSSLPMASLLYLAEFAAEAQEDLPSFVRMNAATGAAGIAMDSLLEIRQENAESLSSLKFAA
jgi:HD-like signal output (HDOD) protein